MATNQKQPDIGGAGKYGFDPDRLIKLKQVIENDTTQGTYDGAEYLVARGGSIVTHEAVGYANPCIIESLNFLITEEAELPAGGAVSTANDVFQFFYPEPSPSRVFNEKSESFHTFRT